MIPAAVLTVGASLLLNVSDPVGDTRGDGSYRLPTALVGGLEGSLDLRELRAENDGGKLRLSVGLGGLGNPWNAPAGQSAALVDVFVKTRIGGQRDLGDTGFSAGPGDGWQVRYQVSGFGLREWVGDANGVRTRPPTATAEWSGSTLTLRTDLPAGRYSYWVTSRVYSPLSAQGFLVPSVSGGDSTLVAPRPGMPSPVDVLSAGDQTRAYTSRVLPASGELRDRRPIVLLVLSAVGLVVAVLASFRAWRR